MNGEVFLDTNILVYTFDQTAPEKSSKANRIIQSNDWQISWQVVQEFANVALHRFATPMASDHLTDYLDLVLWPHCTIFPSADLYRQALTLHQQTQYRFFDSLIVTSALVAEASVLYSEDLQHGREIGSLRIENPFI